MKNNCKCIHAVFHWKDGSTHKVDLKQDATFIQLNRIKNNLNPDELELKWGSHIREEIRERIEARKQIRNKKIKVVIKMDEKLIRKWKKISQIIGKPFNELANYNLNIDLNTIINAIERKNIYDIEENLETILTKDQEGKLIKAFF